MVGIRSFPFGARPIFRCELLVWGRVLVEELSKRLYIPFFFKRRVSETPSNIYIKPCKEWDKLTISTCDRRISEPSTVSRSVGSVFGRLHHPAPAKAVTTLRDVDMFAPENKHMVLSNFKGFAKFKGVQFFRFHIKPCEGNYVTLRFEDSFPF